jgi:preprotein translocase subunit SecA
MHYVEQRMLLSVIDRQWIDYLTGMEDLRQEIGLQAIAQRDPLIEYQRNAFQMFDELKATIQRTVVSQLFSISLQYEQQLRQIEAEARQRQLIAARAGVAGGQPQQAEAVRKPVNADIGRNDPCPCGSGRKFKVCHLGREAELAALMQARPDRAAVANDARPARGRPSPTPGPARSRKK